MNKKKSFEESVKRLEEILAELENSDIKLDAMLQLYEEGSELIKICLAKLDDVENKINFLSVENNELKKKNSLEDQ